MSGVLWVRDEWVAGVGVVQCVQLQQAQPSLNASLSRESVGVQQCQARPGRARPGSACTARTCLVLVNRGCWSAPAAQLLSSVQCWLLS